MHGAGCVLIKRIAEDTSTVASCKIYKVINVDVVWPGLLDIVVGNKL